MAKRKIEVEMYSYGEYDTWDKESREMPKLIDIANEIKAEKGTEFGYILHINKAKGKTIQYCIEHPPFTDEQGNIRPSFTGEVFINSNNYKFFLGDYIWEPIEDKMGIWTMTTKIDGEIVAKKSLKIVPKKINRKNP